MADAATIRKVRELKRKRMFAMNNMDSSSTSAFPSSIHLIVRVGAPFVLFSILAAWVVTNALDGKIKEMETSQGKATQSLRQVALEAEHEEMMERLNKIVSNHEYDNTTRIKRPHEILEERRQERERRNAWHRRLYRAIVGERVD